MTEEERLAYIAKHPIVPTEVSEIRKVKTMQREIESRTRNLDNDIHIRFMRGETLTNIANELDINYSTLINYINKHRRLNPDKWPKREAGRRKV